ncbi:Gfo/Idh/MocA family protein [Paenibacillus alkalitolerans]|uniref:Gfo/Idh/MocA family protein n=1 Tax=Paenibacillus alkalitolerans TaxID=2799335 RepID=UPI0018F428BC|nr:Gfo/Idh/MocA family oxidoreductase [Paenibacillus alkalitolerans]
MIKVAMLSFWHVHAGDYARQATEHRDTEIVAIWDEIPERGRKEAEKRGVAFYESLDELLAQAHIDAVIVDTPTNMHRDVMVKAAQAGKHIFTEKVLAPTLKEVNEILSAVDAAGVKLTVSLPRLNDGYTIAIQNILEQELLGELTLVRVRLSHNGATAGWLPAHFFNLEQCLGGALIDLGCHPMYLTRLFLGMPESVSAHYGYVTRKEVEDNAVSVLKYASGALGIVEAGFVNSHSPFSIEIHGKEGTLLYGTPERQLLLRTNARGEESWTGQSIPANVPSAFEQWVYHIKNNTTAAENINLAIDLTKLMEASDLSAKSGCAVALESLEK